MGSYELQLKLRQHQGKQLLPRYLGDLSRSLNKSTEDIKVLDLETTDKLWKILLGERQLHLEGAKPSLRRIWLADDIEEVKRLLNGLKERIPDRPMVLFRSLSEYCGAVETTSREVLENAFRLISLDGEDLMAIDYEGSYGIVFENYTEWTETGSLEVYQLLIWGMEWLDTLSNQQALENPPNTK